MARAKTVARDFELLVESFEKACGAGISVKSPDRLRDVHTRQLREVDVSLRYGDDSTPKLVIVECRKRGRKADVCWVEQIAQKLHSVGANGAILMAEGFSKPARIKAQCLGLEIRTVQESRDPQKMRELFHHTYCGMVTRVPHWELIEWAPVLDVYHPEPLPVQLNPEDMLFRVEPDGQLLSFKDIVDRSFPQIQNQYFQAWEVGEERQTRSWHLVIPPEKEISVVTDDGPLRLSGFKGKLRAWYQEIHEEPDKAYSYDGDDGAIVKAVEHNSNLFGQRIQMRLIHASDTGLLTLSTEPLG